MGFKPLLAATVAPDEVEALFDRHGSLLASPKLDGVRCLLYQGQAVSRNLKPLPNAHVQNQLALAQHLDFDGELIVGHPQSPDCFQLSQSGVMSRDGRPNFAFWVFDRWGLGGEFETRLRSAKQVIRHLNLPFIKHVTHKVLKTPAELMEYEGQQLAYGFEGVMLRRPDGPYKQGRSTLREGWLVKLKRFADSEAIVLGYNELETNQNAPTRNHLGRQVRSSHQAGKAGAGKLGSLLVRDATSGVEFEVGSGFDEAARVALWAERERLPGRTLTYKYQPTGVKDKPRFPVFKGWRSQLDV